MYSAESRVVFKHLKMKQNLGSKEMMKASKKAICCFDVLTARWTTEAMKLLSSAVAVPLPSASVTEVGE